MHIKNLNSTCLVCLVLHIYLTNHLVFENSLALILGRYNFPFPSSHELPDALLLEKDLLRSPIPQWCVNCHDCQGLGQATMQLVSMKVNYILIILKTGISVISILDSSYFKVHIKRY